MKRIFGIGNPLLDISSEVSEEFAAKYKLNPNGFAFEGPEHEGLYDELQKLPTCHYTAGGATLNSIRVYNALVALSGTKRKGTAVFSGCIGNDSAGKKLKDLCELEGVETSMCVDGSHPSGICGVAISTGNRSLVTRLGAANFYKLQHLDDNAFGLAETADIVYSSGFFLTVCVEGMRKLGEYCAKTNKLFVTNLSAPFLVENLKNPMMSVFPFADIVFGNEEEWEQFGKQHFFGLKDLRKIAEKACGLPKGNTQRHRIVVITQGSNETIVAMQNPSGHVDLRQFPVILLDKHDIQDTNAAGDAFVGGFLFGYQIAASLEVAIKFANYTAQHVIQSSGCCVDFINVPSLDI